MTKRKIILTLTLGCLMALLAVQAPSQTSKTRTSIRLDHERLKNMAKEEREKEIQKWQEERHLEFERMRNMNERDRERYREKLREQRQLEVQRSQREHRKKAAERRREMAPIREQRRIQREQKKQEFEKEIEEAGGIRLLDAKYALRVSEDQWKLIRPKLEKVLHLWDQSHSTVGYSVSGSSTDSRAESIVPRLKWHRPWEDMPRNELTEAQRLARHLRILLEKEDTTPQVFRRKIAALREARKREAEIKKQLAEARRELRENLTTRQEAILVLLRWF